MTTPQTPQQIASRVLELDEKTKLGPWEARTAAPELARAVIKAESDLAEMREENERLRKDSAELETVVSRLGKIHRSIEQSRNQYMINFGKAGVEIATLKAQLRDLRGKADGLAEVLEAIAESDTCADAAHACDHPSEAREALNRYRAAQGVEGEGKDL